MMKELKRVMLFVPLIAVCGGCTDRAASTPASSVPGAASITDSTPEPAPFESISLASDSSYVSPRIEDGAKPGEVREFTKLKIRFCWCPPATFQLGSSPDSKGHLLNEGPVEVTLSRGFWLQQTELTQDQYEELMGSNPSFYKGAKNPVDSLTWAEAEEVCQRLSQLPPEKEAGNLFRLPTEAEWEYGCRAGTSTEFSFGDDEVDMDRFAWYSPNSARTTHPVGEKEPNAWGLFDMHGNVAEWCQDYYAEYPREAVTDPRGPESGEKRTSRGGGWFFLAMFERSAHRDASVPLARYAGRGVRLVATTETQPSVASGEASTP